MCNECGQSSKLQNSLAPLPLSPFRLSPSPFLPSPSLPSEANDMDLAREAVRSTPNTTSSCSSSFPLSRSTTPNRRRQWQWLHL